MNHKELKKFDRNEIDLPDTLFVRDIETRVFQSIVLRCLAKVNGVSLIEGNLIDNLLGREVAEGLKGIYVEQDQKNHSVSVKIEVNVAYGVPLPEKAEEIQTKIAEEISTLTGLHVATVHVVFVNLIHKPTLEEEVAKAKKAPEYDDNF